MYNTNAFADPTVSRVEVAVFDCTAVVPGPLSTVPCACGDDVSFNAGVEGNTRVKVWVGKLTVR